MGEFGGRACQYGLKVGRVRRGRVGGGRGLGGGVGGDGVSPMPSPYRPLPAPASAGRGTSAPHFLDMARRSRANSKLFLCPFGWGHKIKRLFH